ncbi:MAG: hypothetical protein KJZ93_15260 [Caldilineaceae bacterium]|nr:hypothetical protein [Caldilineaceae bacterium]
MVQFALVAFYGEKPTPLANLLTACQEQLRHALGEAFLPYQVEQIHATMAGLESVIGQPGVNDHFAQLRGEHRVMDFAALLHFLRRGEWSPITVQLGGFADRAYPFTSRGRRPFDRSFTIQGDKTVLMGWPVAPKRKGKAAWPTTLDGLRRAFQAYNVLHKYHAAPADMDNDCYLRLGLLDLACVSSTALPVVAADLRTYLSIRQPLYLPIDHTTLSIVAYTDERLPPASTQAWRIDDPALDSLLPP